MSNVAIVAQKEKLYSLLFVKMLYQNAGIEILEGFEQTINFAKAGMEAEDIAFVEKQITEQKVAK